MTAKQYLNQIRGYDYSIERCQKEIERLESDLIQISGIDYSKPQVDSSPSPDAVSASALDEIRRLQDKYRQLLVERSKARDKITGQILAMDHELFRAILSERYIDMMQLAEIAERHHYSLDYITHAHGWALQEFERLYKDDMF